MNQEDLEKVIEAAKKLWLYVGNDEFQKMWLSEAIACLKELRNKENAED